MRKNLRRMSGLAAPVVAAVLLVPTASASSSTRPSFDGSCELTGVAHFDRPVTNESEQNGGTFRSQPGLGNCVGVLRAGRRRFDSREWSVRARARARGEFSCISGNLAGSATMVFLRANGKPLRVRGRRVEIKARIEMAHTVVGGTIEFSGARDTTAGGVYSFTPSLGAVSGCAEDGDRSLPMAVRMSTRGEFVSRG